MTDEIQKRGPGRPPKQETGRAGQIKAERRRRNTDTLGGKRRRLAVKGELDRENYEYRWVNDVGNRLHSLTVEDDWEVVPNRNGELGEQGVGSELSKPVGTGERGQSIRSILCRKPIDYYRNDAAEAQRQIDETEASMKRGATPGAGNEGTYKPESGIQITHGGKS